MATAYLRADSARNNPCPESRPEDMPEVYASICAGDCLAPIYPDGTCLVFSRDEKPAAGDFVGIWLRPDALDPDENPRRVKRLVSAGWPGIKFPFESAPSSEAEPLVILEMLNPPKRLIVRASRVLAMHKVIGQAETNGDGTARMKPAA